jgi:hypothetical protein
MLRIVGFICFVHCPEFYITRAHNVLETECLSVSGEGRETPTLLGFWTSD